MWFALFFPVAICLLLATLFANMRVEAAKNARKKKAAEQKKASDEKKDAKPVEQKKA